MDINPLCVILVKNGSRGDRLLFKYPYVVDGRTDIVKKSKSRGCSAYSLGNVTDTVVPQNSSNVSVINTLNNFSDKVLSNLFAVKSELSDTKFELKVNEVRFVGHPVRLNAKNVSTSTTGRRKSTTIILFNIVFALKATINHDVVDCYHDLSQRLGVALRHEESRCSFLSSQTKEMLTIHDEMSHQPEDGQYSPFEPILEKCLLAQHLRQVYDQLCGTGTVSLRINHWIEVTFCLPHKVYHAVNSGRIMNYHGLLKGLRNLKPYHTMLLLAERSELLESLDPDASPSLRRFLQIESPSTPFSTLAADADVTFSQIFMLVSHLVYWGKATIIFPVCSTNVYVLSNHISTVVMDQLSEKFSEHFNGKSLMSVLADFSLPVSLSDMWQPTGLPHSQQEQVQQLLWLLRYGLVQQLHTYVYLAPPPQPLGRLGGNLPHIIPRRSQENSLGLVVEEIETKSSKVMAPTSLPLKGDYAPDSVTNNLLNASLLPAEKEMVLRVDAANYTEDLRTFARLCVYFRGHHHLEEMMYRSNLRRSQVLQLVDKFRSVLITCQYPDETLMLIAGLRSP